MKPLEQRKNEFYQEVAKFRNVYSPEMLRAFYDYWTEHNPKGRKMRFEMQKTFEIAKRLGRWNHNQETRFGTKPKSSNTVNRRFPNFYDARYVRENKLTGRELSDYYAHLRGIGFHYNRSTHKWEDNGTAQANP